MLRTRLIVIITLLPLLVFIAAFGEITYIVVIAAAIAIAAWEFWRMFRRGGYSPSVLMTVGGAVLFCLQAYLDWIPLHLLLTGFVLLAATFHLVDYERGQKDAPLGLCITLAGSLYWGILGSYLIHLRWMPDGFWWLMLVLPAVWASDGGGYLVGRAFGKHFMAPHISPKKTWEGFLGGLLFSLALSAVLGALWHVKSEQITWLTGLLLGGLIAILAPLGDLTASMFKRLFSLKDSSNLIPGHGGMIDRIDTWVWAAAIGYFFVLLLP